MGLKDAEENNNCNNRFDDSSRDMEIKRRIKMFDADFDHTGVDDEEDIAKCKNRKHSR